MAHDIPDFGCFLLISYTLYFIAVCIREDLGQSTLLS
jgi:hypothetical protein